MKIQVAFYKGTVRFFDRSIQWLTKGPYSHCELVIDGVAYSSSSLDGGVRSKVIEFNKDHWDFVEIDTTDARAQPLAWFNDHMGDEYDYLGLLGFTVSVAVHEPKAWFCSEACALALGIKDASSLTPNQLFMRLLTTEYLQPRPLFQAPVTSADEPVVEDSTSEPVLDDDTPPAAVDAEQVIPEPEMSAAPETAPAADIPVTAVAVDETIPAPAEPPIVIEATTPVDTPTLADTAPVVQDTAVQPVETADSVVDTPAVSTDTVATVTPVTAETPTEAVVADTPVAAEPAAAVVVEAQAVAADSPPAVVDNVATPAIAPEVLPPVSDAVAPPPDVVVASAASTVN